MPLMMFNNLTIDAADSRMKDDMLNAIEEDREGLLYFLKSYLHAQDLAGSNTKSADVIKTYLSKRNIRTVVVTPPGCPASITSLINQSEGPSLVMSGLLHTSSSNPASSDFAVSCNGSKRAAVVAARRDPHDSPLAVATKASMAALTAAYTYLHRVRTHLPGTLTFLALSDDSVGSNGSLDYLLHEEDRKELFSGECVLDASPTAYGTVQVSRDHGLSESQVLADALRRNAEEALRATAGVEVVDGRSYADAWRAMGVPVYTLGMEGGSGEEADVEEYLGLVKVFALAGWEYMRSEGGAE